MIKNRAIALVVVVAVAAGLLAAFYLVRPGTAPRTQEPLVLLSGQNFGEFEKAFDQDTDVPRLVLLLSPT